MKDVGKEVESIRRDLHRRFGKFDCSLFALQGVIGRLKDMKLRTTDCPVHIYQAEIDDLLMCIHKWLDGTASDSKEKKEAP